MIVLGVILLLFLIWGFIVVIGEVSFLESPEGKELWFKCKHPDIKIVKK